MLLFHRFAALLLDPPSPRHSSNSRNGFVVLISVQPVVSRIRRIGRNARGRITLSTRPNLRLLFLPSFDDQFSSLPFRSIPIREYTCEYTKMFGNEVKKLRADYCNYNCKGDGIRLSSSSSKLCTIRRNSQSTFTLSRRLSYRLVYTRRGGGRKAGTHSETRIHAYILCVRSWERRMWRWWRRFQGRTIGTRIQR